MNNKDYITLYSTFAMPPISIAVSALRKEHPNVTGRWLDNLLTW